MNRYGLHMNDGSVLMAIHPKNMTEFRRWLMENAEEHPLPFRRVPTVGGGSAVVNVINIAYITEEATE